MAKKNLIQLTVNADKKISMKHADISVDETIGYLIDGISLCLAQTKVNHGEEVFTGYLEKLRKYICDENYIADIEKYTPLFMEGEEGEK